MKESLAAGHSLESVDVVSAGGGWVILAGGGGLVALLHVLEHLTTLAVAHAIGRSTEVGGEEGTEGWDGGSAGGGTSHLEGVGWGEQEGRADLEALHVWVEELTAGERVDTLERMSSDISWMRVI